jgi:hypothetical protein
MDNQPSWRRGLGQGASSARATLLYAPVSAVPQQGPGGISIKNRVFDLAGAGQFTFAKVHYFRGARRSREERPG